MNKKSKIIFSMTSILALLMIITSLFNLQNIVAQENIDVKLVGPSSNKPYGICGVIQTV